jgi:hypothetical protein
MLPSSNFSSVLVQSKRSEGENLNQPNHFDLIPLSQAVLCEDCARISCSRTERCIGCGSRATVNLANILLAAKTSSLSTVCAESFYRMQGKELSSAACPARGLQASHKKILSSDVVGTLIDCTSNHVIRFSGSTKSGHR